jgi:hypothetical protein
MNLRNIFMRKYSVGCMLCWSNPNDFLSRLVTMDETWLYHCDPETRQQSMEWRHSGSPRLPKKSRVQKPIGKFLATFSWAKLWTRNITHLCWCNWRTFWRENAEGSSQKKSLFLQDNSPAHRALETQSKMSCLGFQYLDYPRYSPDLTPSDNHLFPGLKNNNWKIAIFRPTWRSLLPQRPGWTGKHSEFLFWLARKS